MPSMIEYTNSHGVKCQVPKKYMVHLRTREKKHVTSEVMELVQRITKRCYGGHQVKELDVSLELGVKMGLVRQVFTDLMEEGLLMRDGNKFKTMERSKV